MVKVICARILPQGETLCIDAEEARVVDLVESARDKLTGNNIIVLVDDKLVEDYTMKITSGNRVLIIEEFLGG
ncbi:hypothetical protein [Desulfurococcus amylolyticus]|uniref:ThiamineS protein n=1 Tax=Desulfurococcus amylolyticus DSM 16532 TaxID=768672 RepID=I3XPQ4_DESAM|nr:hypothetical protein [Desulfurococcus amylolyticus]AFL65928.1 hypothetical protein Desfe_0013 [Desulfurococcus amylolyticus DSM 16532]